MNRQYKAIQRSIKSSCAGSIRHQAEVKEKKDGAVVATVRDKLSSDGNELTITTSAKGRANQITVWTRTGGTKVADNLFAGEWTQDLSKTRLRQGLVLKIEADGKEGVRFSGDFSYTARFDGKEYDLKNSRNDTVTLQLVDAHTVDAIYRRDDQSRSKGSVGGFRRRTTDDSNHDGHVGNRSASNGEVSISEAVTQAAPRAIHPRG